MLYNSKNKLTSVRNAHFKIFFFKYISQNFKKESVYSQWFFRRGDGRRAQLRQGRYQMNSLKTWH